MLLSLLILFISAATWIAILWLAIAPDFTKWSNLVTIALHALPPLTVWLTWVLVHRYKLKKKSEDKDLREQQAQAEREATREAARKKHEEAMRQRHFGCDCRFVAMRGLALSSKLPLPEIAADNIDIQSRPLEEALTSTASSIVDQLAPSIRDALATLYDACGAAAAFPIFIQPPSDISGQEAVTLIRNTHKDIIEKSGLRGKLGSATPQILFLPSSGSTANRTIALFDSAPDLPGAVVLAFDSPLTRNLAHDSEENIDPALQKREQQAGKPSEGVITLLLTNPDLHSILKVIDGIDESAAKHDSMTPFWDKTVTLEGHLAWLARINLELRNELTQLPVLGRIRRGVFRDALAQPAGVLDMTRTMQDLLEQAQINASLIELPFTQDDASPAKAETKAAEAPPPDSPSSQTRCRWLVHNAGGVDHVGKRLGALGAAMHYFQIDLDLVHIDMSTNIVTRIGDLGYATGLSQLAFGVAHAADTGSPTLCVEFTEHGGIAFSFTTPADKQA